MKEKSPFEFSEQKEFILSGTIEEIVSILESDFELDTDEARFITYISTIEKRDKIVFEENELKLWYLNESTPSTAPVFKLPYTISITKFKIEMYHALFIFLGTLILSKEAGVVALGLDFIWALKESISKIEDDEYCVYGRIVDFVYATRRETFELKDIVPYDGESQCNRRPDTWVCPHWNNETCFLTEEQIIKILDKLAERGILIKINQYWKMVK